MEPDTNVLQTRAMTVLHTAPAPSPPPSPASPPIFELLRLASYSLSVVATYTRSSFRYLVSQPLWNTLVIANRPISYLLAPFFVFLRILLDAFIFTPYAVIRAVLVNIYPIYVFLGASLLCAACIGLGARLWVQAIRYLIFGPKRTTRSPRVVTKTRKRVSIKDVKKEH